MGSTTIHSVELVNFMCHDHLKIVFEKMITCICGRNGTGKSAIMVSLGILFGQRAQALERGNSFKNLIKTGCNQAIIRVVINNHMNYKLDRYGTHITIEKRLRPNGSKISIYSQEGRIFNTKKSELENIVCKYGLKFDNPLNFLTQEKSKRLLNMSKPELLYDFYYQGTEFKDIQDELEASFDILREMGAEMEEATARQNTLESKLRIQRENLEFLEFDVDGALEKLSNEEAWRKVAGKRQKLYELTEEISSKEKEIAGLQEEREAALKACGSIYQEESVKGISDRIEELTLQYHSVDNEHQEFLKDQENCVAEIERIKSKSKIELIASKLADMEGLLDTKSRQFEDLERRREIAGEAAQAERSENEEREQRLYALRKQIEYLKKNSCDPSIKVDLENFKRIDKEIQMHTFSDLVIGPVSKYVRLKEQKWFKPASIILKKSLTNYIVFNNGDKVQLFNILKKLNMNYSITQMSSKRVYKNLQTNSGYKTLLDVLEITEGLVLNQLVMLNNIEQIALIDTREDAHKVVRSCPSHIDCAYTPSGDRIKMVNGSLSDFRPRDDGSYWFEDKTSKIAKYEARLAEISICEDQKRKYCEITSQIRHASDEIMELEKRCKESRLELEMLQNLKENDTNGLEKKLLILGKSISSLYNRKKSLEKQIQDAQEQKASVLEENARRKREYLAMKEVSQQNLNKIDYDIMVSEHAKASKIQEKMALRDEVDEDVRHLGVEPGTIRNSEETAKERAFLNDLRRQAESMDTRDSIVANIARLESELSSVSTLREKFEKSIEEATAACNRRVLKRDQIKRKDTEESVRAFKEYTMKGGYEGEMHIDHENKRLDIRMKAHNSLVGGSRSTLSGGERSFAGVCFLLSMWRCFKCPVKILDEFDVFMDSLNRKMAIRSLLEFFRENEMQVILITPLSTEDLAGSECDVKVLKKALRDKT